MIFAALGTDLLSFFSKLTAARKKKKNTKYSNMKVSLDSGSDDEEEPLFNLEDMETKPKEVSFWKRFTNSVKELTADRRSFKATLCYCGVFMVFGMSDEVIGPTLLELRCLTGKSLTLMSLMFFIHDLCNVFGSTSGGFLVDR